MGLKIEILAKNVNGLYGIKIVNSINEIISAYWMREANNIQSLRTSEGIYVYVEYNWDNMSDGSLEGQPFELTNEVFNSINDPRESITTEKIADKAITQQKIDSGVNLNTTTLTGGLYGQVGDSISEGVGLQTLLDTEDAYNPISGTRKATYGYYIAKLNRMRWANYGISGSTLGFVVANGSDKNGFSKENKYLERKDRR